MSQDTNVKELVINQLTKEQYNKLKKENKLSKTELYIITDDEHYTNEEIVNLLKTKQNVLVAGDNIVISDNIISADLKRYAKTIDTLYGCRRTFYDKPINLRERLDLNIQDSVDRSCPTNYIKINGDLYHINVKTNAFDKIKPSFLYTKEYVKFTGGYYYSQDESNHVILLDQDGRLDVGGAKDWYKGLYFKDICGEVNTKYKELGLGISSSDKKSEDNKLYSIYKENNEIICNKISDINTWTKITGFVQNFPSYGYVTNAYGIADGKLYEIRCNTNLECEAVLIDEESGWTNISGSSGRGEFFSCIGIKNGKIYIINNGIIKLVNLDEDCSNAILCQQCGQKAYFINNKKLYAIYNITSGDNVFTPVYLFNNKEVYSYDLYYNDWVSSSIYHISNTDDSNYRYLYEGKNVVDETSTLNNIDKLYNFSNTNFNVAFVAKKLYYTKNDINEQYKKLVAKIDYNKDKLYIYNYYNEEIAQVDIKISTDNTTVNYNDNNELQSIGEITKNGLVKHTWIGTQEEYENDLQSGIIDETTEVLINDSVAEVITPQVEFNAPTKLSELANDMNFVDNTNLNNKVNDLNTKINSKANDIDVVHVTGNEDIDGNKTFLSEINIKTGNEYTKIGHKNSTSNTPNLQDGYIKFGKNILKFGEQNVQGEAHNTEKDIFHSGNLVAGQNVTITQEDNKYKINGIDVNFNNYYTKNETYDSETIESLLDIKQDKLTAGKGIKLENNTISSTIQGLPIGTIIPVNATSNYVPNGCLPCDGTEYNSSQFDNLWNNYFFSASLLNICTYAEYEQDIATYGQCGKFAVDITNNKFKVPLIKNGSVIQQALTTSEEGKSYNAGLPNITGDLQAAHGGLTAIDINGVHKDNSAFIDTGKAKYVTYQAGGSWNRYVSMDASRSNPIYGNSNTVQPNAVALRYFVVVANGQIHPSMMDWSAWASGLQGKANTDLSNLSDVGKKVIDGQWVAKTKTLSTATAVGTYTIDLSSYLPNDNYNYIVQFYANWLSANSADGSAVYISSSFYTTLMMVSRCTSTSTSRDIPIFELYIPKNDRTINYKIEIKALNSVSCFNAIAYRRVGTNI